MDVIRNSLSNGRQKLQIIPIRFDDSEDELEHKPVICKQEMVGETSTSRVTHSPAIALRVPVETSLSSTGAISYRVLPLKVDHSMDALSEGESPVPIIATHLTTDNSEPRLALIASSEAPTEANQTVVVSGGQVYLISDTTNVTSGTRAFLPRTTDSVPGQRMSSVREEKRRVTHNEVERRRRDKINNWICRLAKILPDCSDLQSKTSQVSKGVILAKACDYIEDLRKQVRLLSERVGVAEMKQSADQLKQEVEILKRENDMLKNDNALLKAQIHQHGILDELGS